MVDDAGAIEACQQGLLALDPRYSLRVPGNYDDRVVGRHVPMTARGRLVRQRAGIGRSSL
jgi:hypothetical protein